MKKQVKKKNITLDDLALMVAEGFAETNGKITALQADVSELKTDVNGLKSDVNELKNGQSKFALGQTM